MKKVIAVFIMLLLLCGCEKQGPEYLVSSIGIDIEDGKYNICFETVIVNSEDTKQTVRLLKGSADTIDKAVTEIKKQCTQPLLLAHCGVLALGENAKPTDIKEISKYWIKSEQITPSVFFVKTENAEKLLSIKPDSSVAVGFDIMGLLKQNNCHGNRLFAVISSNYKVTLPIINKENGGLKFESKK